MRKLPWLIGLVVVLLIVGSIATIWSRDPLDALRPHIQRGGVTFQSVDGGAGLNARVQLVERVSHVRDMSLEEVLRTLQDYYSSEKGWKWSLDRNNVNEGKYDGQFIYCGRGADAHEVTIHEKVYRTRKELLWRKLTRRREY